MKKFTLFLFAMILATVAFAQAPMTLNKQLAVKKSDVKVQLTESQKKNIIGKVDGRQAKLQLKSTARPMKARKSFKVAHQLTATQEKVAAKELKRSLNTNEAAKKLESFKAKMAQRTGKKSASKAPRKANATPTEAPAGLETETYIYSGLSYVDMGSVTYNVQVGFDGNDVYIQGLLRALPQGWIKGVKNGNQMTFAMGQCLGETEVIDAQTKENLGLLPVSLMYQNGTTGEMTDFVLDVNEKTGVLTDADGYGALIFDDGNEGMLDALLSSQLTPESALGDVSYDLVTPPASAEVFGVDISATSYSLNKQVSNTGMMAIDGNDIYVLGLCPDVSGWVKGTIGANNMVTFPKGQYLGQYAGMLDIWFMGLNPQDPAMNLIDVLATWDPAERTLTFDPTTWIVENADPMTLKFADVFYNVFVEPMGADRTIVVPPAGLETKEYSTTVKSLANYEYAKKPYTARIGFDGDDAYIQGLFFYAPSAWLKGTRNADGSITFVKNQYLGTVQGFDVYVVPCSDEEEDVPADIYDSFTLKYDAANDTYTYNEVNTNISFSVAPESTDAVDIICNVVLNGSGTPDDDINTNVIYEQPEGELKSYTRGGGAYYSFWGYVLDASQSGTSIKIVTNGNDVYMENPISQAPVEGGSWVKGTLDGNKIHVPLKQCILYSDEEGYGYMTAAFRLEVGYDEEYDEEYADYVMTDETEVVFTINEDGTITLDHQSEITDFGYADWIYGLAYTDDKTWSQLGDYNSVYTPFDGEYATIPEGLETEKWAMMYKDDNDYSSARLVDVAIDGDKMYIAGMSTYDPEATMVGTISDGKVTFASDQYMGLGSGYVSYGVFANVTTKLVYDEYYDEYMEMTDFEYLPEYAFEYDAENKLLVSDEEAAFILNAGEGAEEILYITMAKQPKFNYFKEVAAIPADPEFFEVSGYFDDYGYDILSCNVLLEDVNGKYMNQDKVFYTIWVEIDGEKEQFVFDSQDYVGFEEEGIEEMTEIPVNFTVLDGEGYEDISASGSAICLYQSGFDDYGIQTIYYGCDVRTQSNIVWVSGKVEEVATTEEELAAAGINNVKTSKTAEGIYDLQGRKLQKLHKGVNIVTVKGKTAKILVK
ncbi:MAG: hypothetical protein MJZ32_00730 [Bacteroidaceae bacterium]|nr:hypothetical protein [Bacteroidaceae bacterium]